MKGIIFATTLLGARTLLLALSAGMLVFQSLLTYTYQSFSSITLQFLQDLPREMAAFIKAQGGGPIGGDVNSYLTLGYYHPMFLVLGSAAGIALGSRLLAGEVDRGTVLYLLARPLRRWQVVLSKGATLLPATALVSAAAVLGTWLGARLFAIDVDIYRFLLASINAWALFAAIGGVALLCSALAKNTGEAAGWAAAFTLISFFVDFLAELWEPVRRVEALSLFNYFDPSSVVSSSSLAADNLAVLWGVVIVGVGLAVFFFSRRDLRA